MSRPGANGLAAKRTNSLRREIASLRDFIGTLSGEALSQPSACTEWQIRDVIAHLVTAADNWAGSIARALNGEGAASITGRQPGPTPPGENAQIAIELSKTLGDRLVPTLLGSIAKVDQLLANITDNDWETLVSHGGDGVMPLRLYINSVSRGVGVHGWDLRGGVDKRAELGADCVPALVDSIDNWLRRGFCPNPTSASVDLLRFRFNLTGAVIGATDVVVSGDDFIVESGGTSSPNIVYQLDAGDFVLMVYGRLSSTVAQLQGRLTVEGNEDLLERFDTYFSLG